MADATGDIGGRVIGTAGHIDHGKSALVRALTGVDPDRLPEEKRRGITIDLGFAPVTLPGPVAASFVDVPGHERFIRTMVAGASGVDAALLVIALDEGPMPQTREHLEILELLGVRRAVVALTKRDLVDEEWRRLVDEEVGRTLAGGPFATAAKVAVSAVTGAGLDHLALALSECLNGAPPRDLTAPARLAVDRSFSAPGFGTVVTGTLAAGKLKLEDRLTVWPSGKTVRVRGLQVHGTVRKEAVAGERVAVNLAGVGHAEIGRGHLIGQSGAAVTSRAIACDLTPLSSAPGALLHGRTVHLHLGTAECMARIVLLEGETVVKAGVAARLMLDRPIAVAHGDRFVLRSGTPLATVGGGRVLDPTGIVYRRGRADSLRKLEALRQGGAKSRLAAVLLEAQGLPMSVADLAAKAGLGEVAIREWLTQQEKAGLVREGPGDGFSDPGALGEATGRLLLALGTAHRAQPLRAGVAREELRHRLTPVWDGRHFAAWLAELARAGKVKLSEEWVSLPEFVPELNPAQRAAYQNLAQRIKASKFEGVRAAECARTLDGEALLALLTDQGEVVRLSSELVMSQAAVERAWTVLEQLLMQQGSITAAMYRDALAISRRVAVPLLEHFNRIHCTRRIGDRHVAWRKDSG